jgi:hypothetical protein
MRHTRSNQVRASVLFGTFALLGLSTWGCSSDPEAATGGPLDDGGSGGKAGSAAGGKGSGGSLVVSGGTGSGGSGIRPTGGANSSGGASGSSSSSGGSGGDVCVATSRESAKATVALYFMIDISGSMKCTVPEEDPSDPCIYDPGEPYADRTRWTDSSAALKSFFGAPASSGLWAGTQFFPTGDMCDADTYARASSEIAALPSAASALQSSIDRQRPSGQTPTVPSLRGAVRHAADWAEEHSDQQVAVVYLTDGYPVGCDNDNDIDTAAEIAGDAFSGDPSIRTYVLGVGPNLDDLNRIAVSGGTDNAFFVDTGADVTGQLTAALASIREDVTVDCTYTIPEPPSGQVLDLERVNVEYTNGAGQKTPVGYNGTTGSCDEGWQFAQNNTQVVLCGSTCDQVKADPQARIDVAFGCGRMPVEPR